VATSQFPLILTIDVGTSSVRAILFDAQARVVNDYVAQRTIRPVTTPDGGAEFEPEELFRSVVAVVDQILQSASPLAGQIGAVTMATLVGNVMGVDIEGKPATPLYIYADTRNAADAQALRKELGETGTAAAHDRTGCIIHTSYLPARLRWLARCKAEEFAASARWVSIGEYILYRLFGVWQVSYSVAAWSGMLNRHNLQWDEEWLAQLPVESQQLSELADLDGAGRGLQDEWAQRWPALRETPWLPAVGDGAAANIGSGCDSPERVALTVGTTGAMRAVVEPNLSQMPSGLWLYRVTAKRGLLGGATTEGGNLFAWLKETLLLPPPAELERLLQALPAAAHGLTVLPFVGGERAPGWREDARAVIAGLSLHTVPVDIVQACLEAIAYRFALIYKRIAPYLPDEAQIIASGGAILNSPAWLQLMADVLGQPVHTLLEREATSRGLALLGLEMLGVISHPAALEPATGETYEPRPENHSRYADAVAAQQELYGRVYLPH
jgi:gluconokinase